MKVVYLTAGAAGMFCGSCMHDNSLARSLHQQGVDCILQPVYTPIRTDEVSVAPQQVFLGGIHIYLLQQVPWLRFLPRPMRRILDFPPLIRWATRRAGGTDPAMLGDLSVSMLRGSKGNQAAEFARLTDWIANDIQPDGVVLTNLLIGGGLPELRERMPDTKLIVMLQGDDIFLDHLPEAARANAIELCTDLVQYVDHFCCHSQFYAQKMGALLQIPDQKIVVTPLSIDCSPFSQNSRPQRSTTSEYRIGFLARIAPEKGLHRLAEAFEHIAKDNPSATLHAAGWLGDHNRPYLDSIHQRMELAGLTDRFTYHGSPDLPGKVKFLQDIDVLCVPTEYEDPKGLFVLESLAAGTPVVMPDHGAFGELVRSTGGGLLVDPSSIQALVQALNQLCDDVETRQQLASQGRVGVEQRHTIEAATHSLIDLVREPRHVTRDSQ